MLGLAALAFGLALSAVAPTEPDPAPTRTDVSSRATHPDLIDPFARTHPLLGRPPRPSAELRDPFASPPSASADAFELPAELRDPFADPASRAPTRCGRRPPAGPQPLHPPTCDVVEPVGLQDPFG